MTDRKSKLVKFLKKDPEDAFTRYALALEFKSEGNLAEAISLLERLVNEKPDYLGTYYQLGQLLIQTGKEEAASLILRTGIQQAALAGNQHTKSELQSLLMNLELGGI